MKPSKDVLAIHPNALEEDCAEQSQLLFIWGEALAGANKKVSDCEKSLKLCKARISMEVRANPGEFGLEKITDSALDAVTLISVEYQAEQNELIAAEYERDLLKAMVAALNDRRTELENMIKLHGQMYWSRPQTQEPESKAQSEAASRGAARKISNPRTMRDPRE